MRFFCGEYTIVYLAKLLHRLVLEPDDINGAQLTVAQMLIWLPDWRIGVHVRTFATS